MTSEQLASQLATLEKQLSRMRLQAALRHPYVTHSRQSREALAKAEALVLSPSYSHAQASEALDELEAAIARIN